MSEQITPSKKITVGLVLSWIFGIFFGLTGIFSVFSEPIPGIVMLVMAVVLLPPITKLVDQRWKFHLSGGVKAIVIVIGFVIFGSTVDTSKTGKQQNDQSQTQQEQKQAVSNTEQQKDEVKPTEEQLKVTNNEQPAVETKKTEIIPTPVREVTIPVEYKSALSQATLYANTMHMSKRGVYDQLVSEYGGKFTAAATQYAIDNVKANWNANALAQAKTYQDIMHLSPAAVRDQLVSEYGGKFTAAEADYAMQHLND